MGLDKMPAAKDPIGEQGHKIIGDSGTDKITALAAAAVVTAAGFAGTPETPQNLTPEQKAVQERVVTQEKLKAELAEGLRNALNGVRTDKNIDVEATMQHLQDLAKKYLESR